METYTINHVRNVVKYGKIVNKEVDKMMKIVCKECKQEKEAVELMNHSGRTSIKRENGKTYNTDVLCEKCNRVLIKGKEIPPSVLKRRKELNYEPRRVRK